MKDFILGQQIIYGDLIPNGLRKGTVTKISKGSGWTIVHVDNKHEGEDGRFATYCWPLQAEAEILAYIAKLAEIKEMLDKHQGTIYGLRNKY